MITTLAVFWPFFFTPTQIWKWLLGAIFCKINLNLICFHINKKKTVFISNKQIIRNYVDLNTSIDTPRT